MKGRLTLSAENFNYPTNSISTNTICKMNHPISRYRLTNCLTNVGQEADELRPRGEAIGKNLVDVRKDSLAVKNGRARLAVLLLRQVVEPL